MIETILIVLLILWLLGGIALPASASLINIILVLVIAWIVLSIARK